MLILRLALIHILIHVLIPSYLHMTKRRRNRGYILMDTTQDKILRVLEEESQPMSIGEIAQKTDVSWATAKTNILELSQQEKLQLKKVGKNWIIWKEKSSKAGCSIYRKK